MANIFSVTSTPIAWDDPQAPASLVYHGFKMLFNGMEVGLIQSVSETGVYQRPATQLYELNSDTYGRVVDTVPNKNEPYQLAISMVMLRRATIERALGYSGRWLDLMSQNRPFEIVRRLRLGNEIYTEIKYGGCWLTDATVEGWSVDGDGISRRSLTVACTSKTIVRGGI